MFHLLQGLGWGERKTANEIKQKFPSPWCLATIQCARETVRCLQMFSLSCINFTGSLLCTKENSKKKNPNNFQSNLPDKSVRLWVSERTRGRLLAFLPQPELWESSHPVKWMRSWPSSARSRGKRAGKSDWQMSIKAPAQTSDNCNRGECSYVSIDGDWSKTLPYVCITLGLSNLEKDSCFSAWMLSHHEIRFQFK